MGACTLGLIPQLHLTPLNDEDGAVVGIHDGRLGQVGVEIGHQRGNVLRRGQPTVSLVSDVAKPWNIRTET
jgi:hypothetical protein